MIHANKFIQVLLGRVAISLKFRHIYTCNWIVLLE
jgi:hypothetical protein